MYRAECFTRKPSILVSVKACQATFAACQGTKVLSPDIFAWHGVYVVAASPARIFGPRQKDLAGTGGTQDASELSQTG